MFGRKPPLSVKIPAGILKRESEKRAKKLLAAERKKEARAQARQKTLEKAKKKVARKKSEREHWDSFFDQNLRREIWGGFWVLTAIFLVAIFWTRTETALSIDFVFSMLFGIGKWILALACFGFGAFCLFQNTATFPPARMAGILIFFVSVLGVLNLFAPHENSQILAHRFGGAIGFAVSFFPREFLGDVVAAIFLFGGIWMGSTLGFGIKISSILQLFQNRKREKVSEKLPEKVSESKKEAPKRHFENQLEIVDSSQKSKNFESKKIKPTDPIEKSKNKSFAKNFESPPIEILRETDSTILVDESELRQKAELIAEKLDQFSIEVEMKSVHVGPTVTQFTLEPAPGVKLSKITALKNDLTLTLAAQNLRIEAPIRGKSLVGIEIPNQKRAVVGMREMLESGPWQDEKSALKLAMGRDVAGKPVVVDLAKMPHLLIAGKTGSGKSVAMNGFLCSLLWQNSPENLRLILVDPKRVELKPYDKLPHLLTPVIVDPEKCVSALAWAVAEMNRRYFTLSEMGVRNLEELNQKFPEKKEPFIVIVIDELADLMMVAGKDVEAAICRIAQMARAVGMHLMVATQRPSVDVVTGLIKANLPSRVAFKVSSGIDSRTIIDSVGAEDLLGFGDMLYLDGNSGSLRRIQGFYLSIEEVESIANHLKIQFPEMIANDEITNQSIEGMAKGGVLTAGSEKNFSDEDLDERFEEAVDLVLETGKASASLLQRRMEMGYARAARVLDQMESRGIIGPSRGAKPREIYGRGD